jgi:uncharacterized protein YjiS (DUF1127 family)
MSTLFGETPTFPIGRHAWGRPALHQQNSWRVLTFWRVLQLWIDRRSQRKTLGALVEEKHLLDDIGLSRAQALREAAKPFWRQ